MKKVSGPNATGVTREEAMQGPFRVTGIFGVRKRIISMVGFIRVNKNY